MKPRRVVNDVVVTQRGLILDLDATNPLSYSGSGNNWYDVSGQNNHATLYNTVEYLTANKGSLRFNGSDNYAELNSAAQFKLEFANPFTYQIAIKLRSPISQRKDISTIDASYGQTFRIGYGDGTSTYQSGYKGVMIGSYNSYTPQKMTNELLAPDAYSHIAIVYKGGDSTLISNYEIRVNNVIQSTVNSAGYGAQEYVNYIVNIIKADVGRILINEVELTDTELTNDYNLLDSIYNFGI
tara:strand:- start:12696 stop:13415 length:720 start_codon:yes stop_codon:yes gene_type:complete